PAGRARRELLQASAGDLAPLVGVSDRTLRYAAIRVIGHVFAKRRRDEPVDSTLGDAMITCLNDRDVTIRTVAMHALGAMRYDRAVQALTDLFNYYAKGEDADAALDGLAHIAHPSSAPLLVAQLSNRSTAPRTIAIEGVARLGDRTK